MNSLLHQLYGYKKGSLTYLEKKYPQIKLEAYVGGNIDR